MDASDEADHAEVESPRDDEQPPQIEPVATPSKTPDDLAAVGPEEPADLTSDETPVDEPTASDDDEPEDLSTESSEKTAVEEPEDLATEQVEEPSSVEPVTGEIEAASADEDDEGDEGDGQEELFDELLFFEEGEILGETELSDSLASAEDEDRAEPPAGGETLRQIEVVKRRKHIRLAVTAIVLLAVALTITVVWMESAKKPEREIPAVGETDPWQTSAREEPDEAVEPSALDRDVESLNLATAVNLARSEIRRASTPGQDLAAATSRRQPQDDLRQPDLSEDRDAEPDRRERTSRAHTDVVASLNEEGTGLPRLAPNGASNSIFSELGGRTVSVEREPGRVDAEAAFQQEQGHSSSLEPDYFDEDLPRVRGAVERCHAMQLRDQSGVQIERVVLVLTVQPDGSVAIDMDPELAQTTFGRCLQSRYGAWNFRNFEGEPVTLTRTYTLQ